MLRIDGLDGNTPLPFSPLVVQLLLNLAPRMRRIERLGEFCIPTRLQPLVQFRNLPAQIILSPFNEPFDFLSEHKLVDVKSRNVNKHGVMVAGIEPCLVPQFTNQLGKDEIINGRCELRKSVLSIQFTRVF